MPRYKEGVRHAGLAIEIRKILPLLDDVHRQLAGREAIITSALDGVHMRNSLHYKGPAIDLRTRDLKNGVPQKLIRILKEKLGRSYDIVLEPDHIHLEYDPK